MMESVCIQQSSVNDSCIKKCLADNWHWSFEGRVVWLCPIYGVIRWIHWVLLMYFTDESWKLFALYILSVYPLSWKRKDLRIITNVIYIVHNHVHEGTCSQRIRQVGDIYYWVLWVYFYFQVISASLRSYIYINIKFLKMLLKRIVKAK